MERSKIVVRAAPLKIDYSKDVPLVLHFQHYCTHPFTSVNTSTH